MRLAKDVFSYPSWIIHSREGVPSLISQAHRVKPDHVQLIIANGRTLELTQKKLYGCSDSAGKEVELFVDGVLSFAINVSIRYVEYEDAIAQASWSRPYVTAFIEGQWEADILKISQQQIAIDRDFSAKAGADRMQRSRERFGL